MSYSGEPTVRLEVRYISMNHTHLQVEYTDDFGDLEEGWIPVSAITNEYNIFDDIMELEVHGSALEEAGIEYVR